MRRVRRCDGIVPQYDLGDRVLDIIPIPGHQPAGIAIYDRRTAILLTGDTFYPGRLYVRDQAAYVRSIKRLVDFPNVVETATVRRGPHALPTYAIQLADDFHRFYHECRVLGEPEQAFRLGLIRRTQLVIARALDLVGVEAPESM